MSETRLVTIRTAAKIYGVPEKAIRRLVKDGALEFIQVGNRHYLKTSVLDSFIGSSNKSN